MLVSAQVDDKTDSIAGTNLAEWKQFKRIASLAAHHVLFQRPKQIVHIYIWMMSWKGLGELKTAFAPNVLKAC